MVLSLFSNIIKITFTTSVVIAVLLLLYPLIKKTYTAKWRYWVWLFLAVRLLIPFSPSFKQAPIEIVTPSQNIEFKVPIHNAASSLLADNPAVHQVAKTETVTQTMALNEILSIGWLLGIIVFMFYHFVGYLLFKKAVLRFSRSIDEQKIIDVWCEVKKEMGVGQNIRLLSSKKIQSPMMTGFFKPMLILPHLDFDSSDLKIIIKHELIHYKRKDIWYKLLLVCANAVHWFNPLVYFMVAISNKDIEMVCDSEVIKNKDAAFRKQYSEIILAVIHKASISQTAFSTYFYGGTKVMKERFTNIFDKSKKGKGISVICIIVVTLAVAGSLIAYGADDPKALDKGSTKMSEEKQNMGHIWANAWKTRDGRPRYEIMSSKMRSEFHIQQEYNNGDPDNFVIRWSSPWVEDYDVELEGEQAVITYWYMDSTGSTYKGRERLTFGEEKGHTVVTACTTELEMEVYVDTSAWKTINTGLYLVSIPHEWNLDVHSNGSVIFMKNGDEIGSLTGLYYYQSLPLSQFAGNHAQTLSTKQLEGCNYPATEVLIQRTQPAAAHDDSYVNELHIYLIPENSKTAYDLCFDSSKVDEKAEEVARMFTLSSDYKQSDVKPVDISDFGSLSYGATMPELDYASKARVIFHSYFGLFVYDIEKEQIYRSVDLKEIDSNYMQGSVYTEVSVSKDGNTVYIDNRGEGYDEFMYQYNVDTNELTKIKAKKITDRYVPGDITDKISLAHAGAASATYGQIDEDTYAYLWNENSTVGDFKLIIYNEKDYSSHSYNVFISVSSSDTLQLGFQTNVVD